MPAGEHPLASRASGNLYNIVYRPALRHFAVNASVNSGTVGAPEFTAANREFWLRGILLLLRRHNSCMVQKTGEPLNGSPVFGHIDGLHY